MQRLLAAAELGEIVAFQDVQHLDQMNAAGRRRRHRHDIVAPVIAAHGHALDRTIIFQIVRRHDAAGGAHRGHDLTGDAALIECRGAVLRYGLQGVGQIKLDQPVAGLQWVAAVLEQNPG